MEQANIQLNKPLLAITLGVWLYSIAALLLPESIAYSSVFHGVFIFLMVAHAVECIIYRRILENPLEYFWVMVCGIVFIRAKQKYLFKKKKLA